jgi:hypothetical protein
VPHDKALQQLVEGSSVEQMTKTQNDELEAQIKALKKEIGRSAVMREGIMTVVT